MTGGRIPAGWHGSEQRNAGIDTGISRVAQARPTEFRDSIWHSPETTGPAAGVCTRTLEPFLSLLPPLPLLLILSTLSV